MAELSQEHIRERAYFLWQQDGQPDGDNGWHYWLLAEQQIQTERTTPEPSSACATPPTVVAPTDTGVPAVAAEGADIPVPTPPTAEKAPRRKAATAPKGETVKKADPAKAPAKRRSSAKAPKP